MSTYAPVALLLALSLSAAAAQAHQMEATTKNEHTPALTALNDNFRAIYSRAKDSVQSKETPVIICFSDHMKLLSKDKTDELYYLPRSYTTLKIVDHVPLAIYALLAGTISEAKTALLKEPELKELAHLKDLIAKARPEIAQQDYSPAVLARQYLIVDESVKFIDEVSKKGEVSDSRLNQFDASLRQAVLQNAYEAVSAQLSIQDERIAQWKKELGPSWKNIKVVIVSGHMPRQQHSNFQLFSKILGVKEEGDRIIYSEGPADEKDALNLLHTHMLDKKIGQSFFNDSWRMHRDLLADGAAKYLRTHKLAAQD
jgi:hypothetical protein